jgi:hypothetical protein
MLNGQEVTEEKEGEKEKRNKKIIQQAVFKRLLFATIYQNSAEFELKPEILQEQQ